MSIEPGEATDQTEEKMEPMTQQGEAAPESFTERQSTRRNGTALACVGCLSAVVLGVLAAILLFAIDSKSGRLPEPLRLGEIAQCSLQLTELAGALNRYHVKNDSYPRKLDDLYPDFLTSSSIMFCPSDAARKGSTSYKYTQPKADAPLSTIAITCLWHTSSSIKITLDARLDSEVERRYENALQPALKDKPGEDK